VPILSSGVPAGLNLGPHGFTGDASPFALSWGTVDTAASTLFGNPDSATGLLLTGYQYPTDAGYVGACRTAYQVAAQWFGGLRPRAVAALAAIKAYADATTAYGDLQRALAAADASAAAAVLSPLEELATTQAAASVSLAADFSSFADTFKDAVAAVLALKPLPFGMPDPDDPTRQFLAPLGSAGQTIQQMRGAWSALGSDLKQVATILRTDAAAASQLLSQLGLAEAQAEWEKVGQEAGALAATLSSQSVFPDTGLELSQARRLGWFTSDEFSNWGQSFRWNYTVQVAQDGSVGLAAADGDRPTVSFRHLPGRDFGYYQIVVLSTGQCLGTESDQPSPGTAVVLTDFTGRTTQMWRPFIANEVGFLQMTVPWAPAQTETGSLTGLFFVQQQTGLLLSAATGHDPFPSDPGPGHVVPLTLTSLTRAPPQLSNGTVVFQTS